MSLMIILKTLPIFKEPMIMALINAIIKKENLLLQKQALLKKIENLMLFPIFLSDY